MMSYSCTVKANLALEAIYAGMPNSQDSSNTFDRNGRTYFVEQGRERTDGAITGQIIDLVTGRQSGSLRIEPDGGITRPVYLRNAAYSKGFRTLSRPDHPYYLLLCEVFTANGVLAGDIVTIEANPH